jgi:hypothetical protein
MQKFARSLFVVMIIALAMTPRFAQAGPCSADIVELEIGIDAQPLSDLARRLQSQFSATVARAKRLDMQGERIGCLGALNAARAMVALADKQ